MIKILFVINNLKDAGAQRHLLDVINGLDRRSFKPSLVILQDVQVPALLDVPVTKLNIKRIYDFDGIKGLLKLITLIKREHFDIIHSYLFSENILASIAGRIAGTKIIITSRRDTGMLYRDKIHYFLMYRLTNLLVDKIICVSKAVKKAVLAKEGVNSTKLEVIYNGVNAEKFDYKLQTKGLELKQTLGISDMESVVGIIANFNWIKGHKDIVEAARIVLQKISNTKFFLIGSGPLLEDLKYRVSGYNLKDKVLFLGVRKDIPELLSIMDVSVNASYSEGMSNTILQSMAAGVPVVATAVDGNLETVIDGVTGLLVPPKNPQAMAEAIIKILENKALAKEMGENAQKLIREKFTLQIMVKNMENLYERLLKPKIGFIFSQFPCYDETFIMREMKELKDENLNFIIYSIKRCKDKIVHDEASELTNLTYYLPLISIRLILINIFFMIRHPFRYISTFFVVFFGNIKSKVFFMKTIGLWPQAVGFAWLSRRLKVKQIHGQWATYPATYALVISRLNNIPFSFTGHAHDIYVDTTMLAEKINKAKFVLTCTEHNKTYLHRICKNTSLNGKVVVNYHGLDLSKFSGNNVSAEKSKNGCIHILSVGSLFECKGFDILIDACKILKDKGTKFECIIAGGGTLEKQLKSRVANLGLEDKIRITGYITQDKLIPLYLKADIFALPMRSEIHWGIPNVLIEALAARVPVICTSLPSIPELIKNNETGIIIPEENPQILAEALVNLYNNRDLRTKIGEAGYRIIRDRFDIKKNSQKLVYLLDEKAN